MRGGTWRDDIHVIDPIISIHPPREGWDRDSRDIITGDKTFQSTHPVRGGTAAAVPLITTRLFQSTHPVRGGTAITIDAETYEQISIHPPREGWDMVASPDKTMQEHFNPPTP